MVAAEQVEDLLAACALVRIRRKRPADALDDFHWGRDPETARFDGGVPASATFSEYLDRLEYELRYPSTERASWALDSPEREHIGSIMYYHCDYAAQAAELGISIGRVEWRSRGIGTAAVVLFLRHLWSSLPVRRVYLHTLAWNERAIRCFRRAGFEATATVVRGEETFVRMEARREWWLLWDSEGRFEAHLEARAGAPGG